MNRIARTLGVAALSIGLAGAVRGAGFEESAASLWSTALSALRLQRLSRIPARGDELTPAADRIVDVSISDDAFVPAAVEIAKGGWIRWVNNDDEAHTATGRAGRFDTGTIRSGKSGQVRFEKEGTFAYFCAYHPRMTGRIVVK